MSGDVEDATHRRTFRFYRAPGADRVVAREEFDELETHGRAALAEAIARFRRYEELPGEVKKLKGKEGKAGLWEIRVKVGNDPFRALFFYDTDIIVVCLTVFYKNQQETPKQDLKRALGRKRAWEDEGKRRES